MPQVVQPDGWEAGVGDEPLEAVLTISGWWAMPLGWTKNRPVCGHSGPATSCRLPRRAW